MTLFRVRTVLNGWTGAPGLNTFYFDATIAPSTTIAADCVGRVRAFWNAISGIFPTTFNAQVNPNVDLLDQVTGTLLGTFVGGAPAVVNGAVAGGYNAYATMVLLRLNTGAILNGRRVVGRAFIGPVAAAVDSGGNPLPANVTTMLTAAAGMLTGATAALPVVWHRPFPAGGATGQEFFISNYTAAPYFAVLRSRRD